MRTPQRFKPEVVALMRAPMRELADEPEHSLRILLRLVAAFSSFEAHLPAAMGIGHGDLDGLLALWDGGRCTMTDLGKRISMSRAAITTLCDRCEGAGFLDRIPDPADRRRVLVQITPKFEALLFEHAGMLLDHVEHSGDRWSAFVDAATDVHRGLRAAGSELAEENGGKSRGRNLTRGVTPREEPLDSSW